GTHAAATRAAHGADLRDRSGLLCGCLGPAPLADRRSDAQAHCRPGPIADLVGLRGTDFPATRGAAVGVVGAQARPIDVVADRPERSGVSDPHVAGYSAMGRSRGIDW